MTSVFIVCGEASGDRHAALVAEEIRRREPNIRLRGIGGAHLKAAGVSLFFESTQWGAMGLVQSLPKIPRLLRVMARTQRILAHEPPDALMLVDFGAFNVRLARWAKNRGISTLYYCPPRSWSRSVRHLGGLIRVADCIATPFPWSAELLNRAGGNAVFVGHPVLETVCPSKSRSEIRKDLGVGIDERLIAILPGSRVFEVRALLSRLLRSAAILRRRYPARFALSLAPHLPEQLLHARRPWLESMQVRVVRGKSTSTRRDAPEPIGVAELLCAADFAWIASGTSTLESACLGVPMVIVYDAPFVSRLEGLVRLRSLGLVGLPNIIAEKMIVPEMLASAFTPQRLAETTISILENHAHYQEIQRDLLKVRRALGSEGASRRTADLLLKLAARPSEHAGDVETVGDRLEPVVRA